MDEQGLNRQAEHVSLTPEDFGFGQLFWEMNDAVVVGDAETGRIVLCNPAAEDLFAISKEAAIGLSLENLVPGALSNPGLPVELPVVRRTGEPVLIELRLSPLTTGRVPGRFVMAIMDDVTVRQQAEQDRRRLASEQAARVAAEQAAEDLRQSEERFRTAFEHAPIGMDVVDLAGRFLRVNAALCRLTGYTESELLARTFQDITHPDDLAVDLRSFEQRGADDNPVLQMEKRYLRKDGAVIWGRIKTSLVHDEHGAPLHYISQTEDITDRIRAEEAQARLAAIVDAAEDGILSCTPEGTILSWNRGAERLYGYLAAEAIGQSVAMLRPPELADDIAEAMERVRQGESITGYETVRITRTGRRIDISLALSPMRDTRGRVVAIASISRDITARKTADVALLDALASAQASLDAKDHFLAMMSHELRTPLQSVLGYADLLIQAPPDALTAEQREDLGANQRGATRMVSLIDQTLDLSRMKAGHLVLERASLDLDNLLKQVCQDLTPEANAKGLTLLSHAPGTPPITGDLGRVYQILLNLAGNAVKFTPAGEVRLTVYPTDDGVAVSVRDTGIGIGPEALEHIFEDYHQGEGGVRRRFGGTGLGLAIAIRLAEGMGGRITVESEIERGSCFTLHLPLTPASLIPLTGPV